MKLISTFMTLSKNKIINFWYLEITSMEKFDRSFTILLKLNIH